MFSYILLLVAREISVTARSACTEVVTGVIMGAGLLGSHAGKLASFHLLFMQGVRVRWRGVLKRRSPGPLLEFPYDVGGLGL